MNIVVACITAYLIIGVGFGVFMEDDQPAVIKNSKILRGVVSVGLLFLWLPYLLIRLCKNGSREEK